MYFKKTSLVTTVYVNQWEPFASEPLLPGVFNEEILFHLMLFVFCKVTKSYRDTKRLENEQNIRTRKAESASRKSVGLYRQCEYCQAEADVLLFMSIILRDLTVPLLS